MTPSPTLRSVGNCLIVAVVYSYIVAFITIIVIRIMMIRQISTVMMWTSDNSVQNIENNCLKVICEWAFVHGKL